MLARFFLKLAVYFGYREPESIELAWYTPEQVEAYTQWLENNPIWRWRLDDKIRTSAEMRVFCLFRDDKGEPHLLPSKAEATEYKYANA